MNDLEFFRKKQEEFEEYFKRCKKSKGGFTKKQRKIILSFFRKNEGVIRQEGFNTGPKIA